jgi:hypothetical protein
MVLPFIGHSTFSDTVLAVLEWDALHCNNAQVLFWGHMAEFVDRKFVYIESRGKGWVLLYKSNHFGSVANQSVSMTINNPRFSFYKYSLY